MEVLRETEGLLSGEISNLRSLMFEIAPVDASTGNLSELIADTVDRFDHLPGISARFVSRVGDAHAPSQVCREVVRILQEALVNVRKHSGAKNVLVSLSVSGTVWTLVVDDDGQGFNFEGRRTHAELDRERKGPRVLKERVRLLCGSLVVDSKPGAGARLEISLPRRW